MIFVDDVDRLDFLSLLTHACEHYDWTLHAYCLMGTHYHVVVTARVSDLSAGMQWLNGVYAQSFNVRHRRRGHLFGGRFSSWIVRDIRHFDATVEYLFQNPVKERLAATTADYEWSGHRLVGEQDGQTLAFAERRDLGR